MTTRIAITSKRLDGLDAPLDPVFGRAAAFVIVESDTGIVLEQIENALAAESQGAGTGVAAFMAGKNVGAVISGRFGPKAYQALSALGIEMWNAPEGITVGEALRRFYRNELQEMEIKRY